MALQTTTNINVDFYDKKYILINAKQLDKKSRYLSVTCYNHGEPISLNDGEHAAYVRYRKADDYGVFNNCDINHKGEIIVELTEQMLAADGICYADLVIINKGDAVVDTNTGEINEIIANASVLSTMTFCIDVSEIPVSNSEIESTHEFILLNENLEKYWANFEDVMKTSKSWAVGDTGIRDGEDTNNSKYWSEQSKKSANNAKTSEQNAKVSETNAKTSEENADISETNAKTSEINALKSEQNAKASEESAKISETNAKTSETNSKTSEVNAKKSEINALSSEENAKTSETNALSSERKAKTSESNALISEQNAKESETKASTSESNAKTYMDNAKVSEDNAKSSETNASNSEDAAAISEDNAKVSETNSKISETNAKSSETNSSISESNAKTSETNALNSANRAQSYAVGGTGTRDGEDTNNSYYYYERVKSIVNGLDSGFIPMGTISFSELATIEKLTGYVYNIRDDFVTTDDFHEGAGRSYTAGTNIYVCSDGMLDCFGGASSPTATVGEVKDYLGI